MVYVLYKHNFWNFFISRKCLLFIDYRLSVEKSPTYTDAVQFKLVVRLEVVDGVSGRDVVQLHVVAPHRQTQNLCIQGNTNITLSHS